MAGAGGDSASADSVRSFSWGRLPCSCTGCTLNSFTGGCRFCPRAEPASRWRRSDSWLFLWRCWGYRSGGRDGGGKKRVRRRDEGFGRRSLRKWRRTNGRARSRADYFLLKTELCGGGVRSSIGGGLNGDVQAGLVVRAADDAEEFWVHDGGGAVLDAGHRSDDWDFYRGECGFAAAASILSSRPTGSRVYGVSDVSQRRTAAVLDFGAGIFRPAEGHEFVGDARRLGHDGHEPGRQNGAGAPNDGLRQRHAAGDPRRLAGHGAAHHSCG